MIELRENIGFIAYSPLYQGFLTCAIAGAKRASQVEENAGSSRQLSPEIMEEISEVLPSLITVFPKIFDKSRKMGYN